MEKRIIKVLIIFIFFMLFITRISVDADETIGTVDSLIMRETLDADETIGIMGGFASSDLANLTSVLTPIISIINIVLAVFIIILLDKNSKKINCVFWLIMFIISVITQFICDVVCSFFSYAGGMGVPVYPMIILILKYIFMLITLAIRGIIILYQINIIKKENNKILKGEN